MFINKYVINLSLFSYTCGTAKQIETSQIRRINLIARDSLDMVCDKNG